MTNHTKQAQALIGRYLGKNVTAKLGGGLFESEPAEFAFRFVDPAELSESLREDYEDYLQEWNLDTVVPIAAVSVVGAKYYYEFAWLFLDWSSGSQEPRVLVTTTDRWKIDAKYTVASLDELGLQIG